WFTEENYGRLGQITTSGAVTETTAPGGGPMVMGPDQNMWYGSGNEMVKFGTSSQPPPSTTTTTNPTTTTTTIPPVKTSNGLYVFVRGGDGRLYYRRFSNGAWADWVAVGATSISDYSVVSDGTSVYVFYLLPDSSVGFVTTSGGAWSSPQFTLGGVGT